MPTKPKKARGPLAVALGKRIRALRESVGKTQDELRHAAGLPRQSTVSDWETGKSFTQIDAIGAALAAIGADPNALLNATSADAETAEMVRLFTQLEPRARGIVLRWLRSEAAAAPLTIPSVSGIE